jgi:hypothetical protein
MFVSKWGAVDRTAMIKSFINGIYDFSYIFRSRFNQSIGPPKGPRLRLRSYQFGEKQLHITIDFFMIEMNTRKIIFDLNCIFKYIKNV